MGEQRFKTTPSMPLSAWRFKKPEITARTEWAAPRASTVSTVGVFVARATA